MNQLDDLDNGDGPVGPDLRSGAEYGDIYLTRY